LYGERWIRTSRVFKRSPLKFSPPLEQTNPRDTEIKLFERGIKGVSKVKNLGMLFLLIKDII
jgi:hypothetical protein